MMKFLMMRDTRAAFCLLVALALTGASALGALTQKNRIVENGIAAGVPPNSTVPGGGNLSVDAWGANNETQVKMQAPPTGTGFLYGGYESSSYYPAGQPSGFKNPSSLQFLNNGDGTYGIFLMYNWAANQYYYTIFSSTGTKTPDQFVDLSGPDAKIGWNNFAGAAINQTIKIRWLIRTNNNSQWYASDAYTVSPVPTTSTPIRFPVSSMTWTALTTAVNSNLNLLAKNDDIALAYGSTATPNLSKVDGGGFVIDTGVDAGPYTSFKPSRLAFESGTPELTVTPSATYGTNVAVTNPPLILGLGNNAGKFTLTNAGGGTLDVKSYSVLTPDGKITAASPALPGGIAANTGADINVTFTQSTTEQTTASLVVTWGYTGLATDKVTTLSVVGRGVIDGTIYETFNRANGSTIANAGANQTPQIMNSPVSTPADTGFKWGGRTHAVSTTGGRANVYIDSNRMTFPGAGTNDVAEGAAYAGSYAYTIFDSMGGTTVDHTLQLMKLQFYTDNIPKGSSLRWLLRDNASHWFITKDVTVLQTSMINTYTDIPRTSLTQGWLRVDTAAETYMNTLGNVVQVAIADIGTLAAETPDFSKMTGGGIYVEQGNTTQDTTAMTYPDLNFIDSPTNGDTMKVTTTSLEEVVPVVPNRRVRLQKLTLNVATGKEVSLNGVNVTVSPSASGVRKVYLYNDVNNDGLLNDAKGNSVMDDACLTNCVFSANTAQLTFRSNQLIVKGVPVNMILAAQFDESAAGKTYSFSVAPGAWQQNTTFGGTGDTVTNVPSTISKAAKVLSVSLPTSDTLTQETYFTETWNGMTVGAVPRGTAAGTSGLLTGADSSFWSYGWASTTAQANAQIVNKSGSIKIGSDISTMTAELNPYNGQPNFWLTNNLPFAALFDYQDARLVTVEFDLTITSTTSQYTQPSFSGRVAMDFTNFDVRVTDTSGTNYYDFIIYPLTDADRFFFSVNSYIGGDIPATKQFEYAPDNILAYSSGNGTGTYHVTMTLAPTEDNQFTVVRIIMKHQESGKTLNWMTMLEGTIPTVKSLRVGWNCWTSAFIDNVTLNTYAFRVNPVKHWSIFE